MLRLAMVFLILALIAGLFGFGAAPGYTWVGAKVLFVVFLVLALLSFLGGSFRRESA